MPQVRRTLAPYLRHSSSEFVLFKRGRPAELQGWTA